MDIIPFTCYYCSVGYPEDEQQDDVIERAPAKYVVMERLELTVSLHTLFLSCLSPLVFIHTTTFTPPAEPEDLNMLF